MNKKTPVLKMVVMLIVALVLAACGKSDDHQADEEVAVVKESPEATAPDLATLLASESRAAEDRARDATRKPVEVIAFIGIEPGMKVIDLLGAGGYYTEVLSLAVGPGGHVVAQNPEVVLKMREGANEKVLTARLADNRLPNVSRLDIEMSELSAEDGQFDAAFTALNLHDIYNNYGEEGATDVFRAVYALLKPGGVFGVIDHDGVASNDNKALHRIPLADAVRVAEAAGFTVEASSGALHVHSDDMSQNVFTEGVRGNTHRFLLRLRKPEA